MKGKIKMTPYYVSKNSVLTTPLTPNPATKRAQGEKPSKNTSHSLQQEIAPLADPRANIEASENRDITNKDKTSCSSNSQKQLASDFLRDVFSGRPHSRRSTSKHDDLLRINRSYSVTYD